MFTSSLEIWYYESFLKSSFYEKSHLFTNFFMFVIQFYTFSYVLLAIIGFYANLRITCAIFRNNTIFFGHTIAKIQIEMKNTLHKKKPYYLQPSGLNPQSNCSLLCVWHFWSLGQFPLMPSSGLQCILCGFGFLHTLKLTKLNFERYMEPTWRRSYYLSFSFLQLSAAPHTCLHTLSSSPECRVQTLHIENSYQDWNWN